MRPQHRVEIMLVWLLENLKRIPKSKARLHRSRYILKNYPTHIYSAVWGAYLNKDISPYSWWKKSCTTWGARKIFKRDKKQLFEHPKWCRIFIPSTVLPPQAHTHCILRCLNAEGGTKMVEPIGWFKLDAWWYINLRVRLYAS